MGPHADHDALSGEAPADRHQCLGGQIPLTSQRHPQLCRVIRQTARLSLAMHGLPLRAACGPRHSSWLAWRTRTADATAACQLRRLLIITFAVVTALELACTIIPPGQPPRSISDDCFALLSPCMLTCRHFQACGGVNMLQHACLSCRPIDAE